MSRFIRLNCVFVMTIDLIIIQLNWIWSFFFCDKHTRLLARIISIKVGLKLIWSWLGRCSIVTVYCFNESSCNVHKHVRLEWLRTRRKLTFSREKQEEITHSGEMDQINNFLHFEQWNSFHLNLNPILLCFRHLITAFASCSSFCEIIEAFFFRSTLTRNLWRKKSSLHCITSDLINGIYLREYVNCCTWLSRSNKLARLRKLVLERAQ